ncbi:MAG: hypothetical protein GF418_08780 [Chitinivibrionales bacterium]|nr:hypothetical protein [Chitinivibrionales bacterium]MBD3395707.1 hypothetical protein [Chitinivibrionales bacterium]
MKTQRMLVVLAVIAAACLAQEPAATRPLAEGSDYVVEQPGTITFKHGIVIVGKVEKPQVMIFLPKEKPYYRDISFERSFAEDMTEPLPFEPIIE